MIEIKNLCKSFGTKQVLNNLNLAIKDNTVFGLIGINGAGKSQLLESIKGPYTKVYMNEVLVQKNDIVYYSFKNNISLPSFGIYDYNSTRQYNNIITNIFNNYKNLYKSYTEHKTTNPQNYYEILGISKETSLDEYCMNNLNASISMKTNSSSNSTTSKNISKSSIAYIVKTVKEKHPDVYQYHIDSALNIHESYIQHVG